MQEEVERRGLDIVVAIDTSKSMLATDIAPNRLTRAKLAALDLMGQAKSDRMGLVAFVNGGFTSARLLLTLRRFARALTRWMWVSRFPKGALPCAGCIDAAGEHFQYLTIKCWCCFTDGEDNDTGALEAAQRAAKEGLRIYAVGIWHRRKAVAQIQVERTASLNMSAMIRTT